MKVHFFTVLFLILNMVIPGCFPAITLAPTPPVVIATPTPIASPAAVSPTATPVATSTKQVNDGPYITALTWSSEPLVPVILYHRFIPDSFSKSTPTKTRLADFRQQLQTFYDNGYSLIPFDHWLKGDLSMPPGRHPLILTIDDAFFADQIFLNIDGSPSVKSGIGILWDFSQQHPDFGFSAALFSNLGDKLYGNIETKKYFLNGDGWKESLEKVIVWGIEHDVMPYNHLYTHPRLDLTQSQDVKYQINKNDLLLRKYLILAGRPDLIARIDNIISLPYSIWPQSKGGKQIIKDYFNPEGHQTLAVVEADYYHDKDKLLHSPYSPQFDRYHIPRITLNTKASLQYLVDNRDQFPPAQQCKLGPRDEQRLINESYLKDLIRAAIQTGTCQPGYYQVKGFVFNAGAENIELLKMDKTQPETPLITNSHFTNNTP